MLDELSDNVVIESPEGSFTIDNFRCVDFPEDGIKMHLAFDVKVKVGEYSFSTTFTEMPSWQFDFNLGENVIVDENNQGRRLIIGKDYVSLIVDEEKDLTKLKINLTINFSKDKVDDFKVLLNAYAVWVLK